MANCAKVSLTGRIVKEPKQTPYQTSTVVSFPMAVNTVKKEGNKYISDFYNISVWGKSAEFIFPRIKNGMLVHVYGDLTLQTYKTKTGEERQSLSVRATEVLPLEFNKNESRKEPDDEDDATPPPF